MRKNLLALDLQKFADEVEDAGVNEVEESATLQEEETSEAESEETDVEEGAVEPTEQSAEENARYAAIRRRAEEDARRRYEGEVGAMNQQITALCQGVTHPVTGQPITNIHDYLDAVAIQQKMARDQELQEKGIDPAIIDQAIAQNPVVMQAQRVIEHTKMAGAHQDLMNDIAELSRIDPNIKGPNDLVNIPNLDKIVQLVDQKNLRLVEAYKLVNFDNFMQHTGDAARQQAINQMRGKEHLASQPKGVATEDDDVEVPAEIMSRYKAEGKTEKQIRELYKTVAGKLHLT